MLAAVLSPMPAQGADLWSQLRNDKGVVVLMRHALAPGVSDPTGFRIGDCSTQRILSAEGRQQARSLGRQFRAERIPVAAVYSSRWCRANQTAELMRLGDVTPIRALDSVFTAPNSTAKRTKAQALRLIRQHVGKPGVLLLVGHQANIIDLTGIAPQSGAAVVVQVTSGGNLKVLGELVCSTPACNELSPTTRMT